MKDSGGIFEKQAVVNIGLLCNIVMYACNLFFFCLHQITKGYEFESETDTEVIPKLIKYIYDNRESDSITFSTLVERVIKQLVSRSHGNSTH